ncbi:MAG TPA: DUF309 domain-containing protein [Actinomycetota bacterium]|nr:DUF309 domain-containing protein [Actinomycetota bacterium]
MRRAPPQRRARHPLTAAEEHAHLVAGSRLFNRRAFYETHEEWEEVWRRASGPRRDLLHGLIQVSVGYEHLKRGNAHGTQSLLRQGARRLRHQGRRAGVSEIRRRALADAARVEAEPSLKLRDIDPPKVMLLIDGFGARTPAGAIVIRVPPGDVRLGG